jgi:hypothetical protein
MTPTKRTETSVVAVEKMPTPIGTRGIQPQNMDELYRFATAVSQSGLAPKGIETPQAIFVALEMGLEVGLPMMASLQNIAVINGRPTIWGDAQLAIVRSTGQLETFEEWYEAGGKRLTRNPSTFTDDTTAVCKLKRAGCEVWESAFSVADAKRANLWGKAGPWSQYPARMLRFRARSFGLRDQFGDALKGFRTTEEAQDDPVVTARNVTPRNPLFTQPDAPAPQVQDTPQDEPQGDEQPPAEADNAGLNSPDPIRQRDLQAVEDVKEANYAKIAAELDAKRQLIGDGFADAGVSFDLFRAWILANRKMTVAADSFAELEEVIVKRLMPNLPALIKQAKAWVEGGAV